MTLIERIEAAGPDQQRELLDLARRYGPADNITEADARQLRQLIDGYRATSGAAYHALGLATVRHLKRIPGWRSPISWFNRTNSPGSWVIVSYHHRAQSCWEWSVWLSLGRAARLRTWKPWNWFSFRKSQSFIGIPWIFQISLLRQSHGWMVSSDGENLIRFAAAILKAKDKNDE